MGNGHMRCSAPVNESSMGALVRGPYLFIRCGFVASTSLKHPLSQPLFVLFVKTGALHPPKACVRGSMFSAAAEGRTMKSALPSARESVAEAATPG